MKKSDESRVALNYVKYFSCIGGECEDTCCAGWTIPIDEETYKKYKKVKDKLFRVRLNKEIVEKRSNSSIDYRAKIKLKNGRCAFLSKEGWCDIYSTLGEGYLSDTCRLYPRTINRVNNRLEYSLISSCPEAARRILLYKEPIAFEDIEETGEKVTISADLSTSIYKAQRWQDYFLEIRNFVILVLQNREEDLEARLERLKDFFKELEDYIVGSRVKKIPEFIKQYKKKKYVLEEEHLYTPRMTQLALKAKQFKINNKIKSKRYAVCLEDMLKGLGLENDSTLDIVAQKYEQGYRSYYRAFLGQEGYMLENYLVNYALERCMPLDQQQPLQSFERMQLYYDLIKCHLIGMANHSGGITKEQVVRLIQSFTKTFDHDECSLACFQKTNYK